MSRFQQRTHRLIAEERINTFISSIATDTIHIANHLYLYSYF